MNIFSSRFLVVLVLLLPLLSGCTEKPAQSSVIEPAYKKHAKSGAAVKLISDSIIRVSPNEIIDSELLLATGDSTGELYIALSTTEGLELLDGKRQLNVQLNDSKLVKIPVKLRALRNGRFYLHMQVTAETGGSLSSRSLALIVQSGPEVQKATQFQKPAGENIISMPAQETRSTP
ncbi:hypothetical protein [Cellvibrio sp.]|uniref:hypothetical protein n=1 Tax=Cellvibrio sp. TaxID=1965322 RepID=UPI003964787C